MYPFNVRLCGTKKKRFVNNVLLMPTKNAKFMIFYLYTKDKTSEKCLFIYLNLLTLLCDVLFTLYLMWVHYKLFFLVVISISKKIYYFCSSWYLILLFIRLMSSIRSFEHVAYFSCGNLIRLWLKFNDAEIKLKSTEQCKYLRRKKIRHESWVRFW